MRLRWHEVFRVSNLIQLLKKKKSPDMVLGYVIPI